MRRSDEAMERRRGLAFTLVELVMVISVVILLAGLTLSIVPAVVEHSERRETATVLQLLDTAVKEWERAADRKLIWWPLGALDEFGNPIPPDRADVHEITPFVLIISEILDVITRQPAARQIIAQIPPDFVYTYRAGEYPPWLELPFKSIVDSQFGGSLTILDAWGVPIYATHPGGTFRPGQRSEPDPDGTIRTYNEDLYGVAPNRQVVFVSAGPDQRFGLPFEFDLPAGYELNDAIRAARADNLYSTPVEFPDE